MIKLNKKELRRVMLVKRNKVQEKEQASTQACFLLKSLLEQYTTIALYYPIQSELDIRSLIDEYRMHDSKNIILPAIEEELIFKLYTKESSLIQKAFQTFEVDVSSNVFVDDIEVIVLPCIAIDKSGHRLGYGKGYYDKALAAYTGIKIGVCYDEAVLEYDFYEAHDIAVNYIVTEKRIIKVSEQDV